MTDEAMTVADPAIGPVPVPRPGPGAGPLDLDGVDPAALPPTVFGEAVRRAVDRPRDPGPAFVLYQRDGGA